MGSPFIFVMNHLYHILQMLSILHRAFIKDHPKLCFLGLAQVDVCHLPMFTDPASPEFMHSMTVSSMLFPPELISIIKLIHYFRFLCFVFMELVFRQVMVIQLNLILSSSADHGECN